MKSKSWPSGFVLACAAISFLAGTRTLAQTPDTPKVPAIALIDPADAPQWQTWVKDAGWSLIVAPSANNAIEARVQALAAAVEQAIKSSGVDPARVYLAGRGDAVAALFYTVSRIPDLWAAAAALGGSPQPAIDTGRIFAANFTNVPVLWMSTSPDDQALAGKLKNAKLNVEWRSAAGATNATVFEWLRGHRRDDFPAEIDCETNSPTFARCYWIQMTKFDTNERNDVLATTVIPPAAGASLDLGAFGFKKDEPGPGVLVSFLPEKYSGPLKAGDRIVALDGRPIADARQYAEMLAAITEERPAVVTVQRGKERVRVETRILLPRRDPLVTARVRAQYVAADKDIQIASRTVKEMRVTIPPAWALGGRLYWNGLTLEKIDQPGCLSLTIDKELLHSQPCAK